MSSTRTTFTLDDALATKARRLGINISSAARSGVEEAVRAALVESDRRAYQAQPEQLDEDWDAIEAWGDE